MTEHEVPTHVQAEDRVILWFTFPQVVAITAVCALSYGAYRYAPFGPSGVRMALAVAVALFGIAMVVGKVGGRRLPAVAADLLRFGLGPRRYAGTPADLVRSEPPPPPVKVQASVKDRPTERSRRARWRRRLRPSFRPHGWFGKRRRRRRRDRPAEPDGRGRRRWGRAPRPGIGHSRLRLPGPALVGGRLRARLAGLRAARGRPATIGRVLARLRGRGLSHGLLRRRRKWLLVAGVVALSAAALAAMSLTAPAPASGQEPGEAEPGLWDLESEIDFVPREPVPGRRLYVEELRVTGDRAHVTLRAATDLEIRVRAFGGLRGREMRFWSAAALAGREAVSYSLPLSGDEPSLTLSWEDGIGQGGAVTIRAGQIPYPLPQAQGELCDLSVTSLSWRPGLIEGTISSECVDEVDEVVRVWTAVGHDLIGVDALIESDVTLITGTVSVTDGGYSLTAALVPDGETAFALPVARGEAVRTVEIGVDLAATLSVPMPDLVRLTHHPARTEDHIRTVRLWRPGTGRTVSRTVTVSHGSGITTRHTISAYLSVPGTTVTRNVTVRIDHDEHVRAVVETQRPIERTRAEALALSASLGADAPFRPMVYPEAEIGTEPARQRPVSASRMRELFGWH